MRALLIACLFLFSCISPDHKYNTDKPEKPNVLFISVDDLRPELGCYGYDHMHTPNIDRLASKGMVFRNAYCQQAVCSPSRNTVMTGLRPDSLKIYDLGTNFRKYNPDVVTLSQYFIQQGYHSESIGKIYHIWHGNHDDSLSWSINPWNPWNEALNIESISRDDTIDLHTSYPKVGDKRLAWYRSDVPDINLNDTRITNHAIKRLKELKDKPFFLGVGYLKPHLPFVAPDRFWDLYDAEEIIIPAKTPPQGSPPFAINNSGELLCCYYKFDSMPVSDHVAKNLIHGYYASVSYIDHEIGRLVNSLNELGLMENTIIVIWGDHGWKLGNYGQWCKHTAFEYDARTTLIFRTPWMDTETNSSNSFAELLDIYPTLCEEAGLPVPEFVQGKSLSPILKNPDASVKDFALSQWPKGYIMGYSLRTRDYRLVSWQKNQNPDSVIALELYDHRKGLEESINIADLPENGEIVQGLSEKLNEVRIKARTQ